MITQGTPLYAYRESTGQVFAVIGWKTLAEVIGSPPWGVHPNAPAVRAQYAIGVEIGIEQDGPPLVALDSGVTYTPFEDVARRAGR